MCIAIRCLPVTATLACLLGVAVSQLAGCKNGNPSVQTASYAYQWKGDDTEEWAVYEVSSSDGREEVQVWMSEHTDALKLGEEMGPQLAWRPRDVLINVRSDGTSQKYYLLRRYPVDARQPVATREYAVNISDEEINALRAIFVEHGVVSDRDFVDSADGG